MTVYDNSFNVLASISGLTIHTPILDFPTPTGPLCSDNGLITFGATPIGGNYSIDRAVIPPYTISGNRLDPTQVAWPVNHFDSLRVNVTYLHRATYSDGTNCPFSDSILSTMYIYDNRLDNVTYSPITRTQANAIGSVELDLDINTTDIGISTTPDMLCNPPSINCVQHLFSGTNIFYVGNSSYFDWQAAGLLTNVLLNINNNGCTASATGTFELTGSLVTSIPSLPDTLCRGAAPFPFFRDPALAYKDTIVLGDREITNDLIDVTTAAPINSGSIRYTNTVTGSETFEIDPALIALASNFVIVEMTYENRTLSIPGGLILTSNTFVVVDTIFLVNIPLSPSITGVNSTYCENDLASTVQVSPAYSGGFFTLAGSNDGGLNFNLTSNLQAGNVFDPSFQYNSLTSPPNELPMLLKYSYDYYGCAETVSVGIEVYDSPIASFLGLQANYLSSDPGDNLFGSNDTLLGTGTFSGNGVGNTSNGRAIFYPSLSNVGTNTVQYIYTTFNGCADTSTQSTNVSSASASRPVIFGLPNAVCDNADTVFFYRDPSYVELGYTSGASSFVINQLTPPQTVDLNHQAAIVTVSNIVNNEVYGLVPSLLPPGTTKVIIRQDYEEIEDDGVTLNLINRIIVLDSITINSIGTVDINSAFNFVPYGGAVGHSYCADDPAFTLAPQPSAFAGAIQRGFITGTGVLLSGNNYTYDPSLVVGNIDTVIYDYTTAAGCNAVVIAYVGIDTVPQVTITGPSPAVVCSNDSPIQLIGTPSPTPQTTGVFAGTGINATSGLFDPSIGTVVNRTLNYTFTDSKGCTGSTNFAVTVNQATTAAIGGYQNQYLTTDPTDKVNSLNDTINGQYQFGGNLVNAAGFFTPSNLAPGTYIIDYMYEDANGCIDTYTDSVVIITPLASANPIATFSNNDVGAPSLDEACYNSSISFTYDNLSAHPVTIRMNRKGGNGQLITISGADLTFTNMANGSGTGVQGTVTFTVPALAATGPVLFLDNTNLLYTTTPIVIHNPAIDFLPQTTPTCATNTAVDFYGFPSGGTFISNNYPNAISNNQLDATRLPWPSSHVESLTDSIIYLYTPSYSDGTSCASPVSRIKNITIYDNRLDQVEFATLSKQDALAGNKLLTIDTSQTTIVTGTRPDLSCNGGATGLLTCTFPFQFSGAFVDQNNNFLSPIADGRNLVFLEFNNNGCRGSASGFIDISGRLTINNLPDTVCRSTAALQIFSRDSNLVFVDSFRTNSNGDIRRTIQNELLNTYTTNPVHGVAISPNIPTPGAESFLFNPTLLPGGTTLIEVNMEYQNLTTITSTTGVVQTILADTFTVSQTVGIVSSSATLSIGNLKAQYCANEVGDTLFPSLGFLGPNFNELFLLSNGQRIDLVNNILDPKAVYDSLVPSGVGNITLQLVYNGSFYGCPSQITRSFTITQPLSPSYTSNSPYCRSDAPDLLQRAPLQPNIQESFQLAAGIDVNTGIFNPGNAGNGANYITYVLTDLNNCSYTYLDSIFVASGPVIDLTLDNNSASPAAFCYDHGSVVIGANVTSQNLINTPLTTYGGAGRSGLFFNPSTLYTTGVDTSILTISMTDIAGCTGTDTIIATIESPPVIDIDVAFNGVSGTYGPGGVFLSEHSYCRSATPLLVDGAPSYISAAAASISGNGIVLVGNNYQFDPALVPGAYEADTIVYFYQTALGCTNTDTAIIKLDVTPVVQLSGFPSTSVCINAAPIQLIGTPAAATIAEGFFSGSLGVDSLTGVFTPILAGNGPHTITYSYDGISGCSNSTSRTITVSPVQTASFSGIIGSSSYCQSDDDVVLISGNAASGTYQFYGDLIVPGTDTLRPSLAPTAGTYTVYYVYSSANGCSDTMSRNVTIYPIPDVRLFDLDSAYCINGNVDYFSMLPSLGGSLVNPDSAFSIFNGYVRIDPTKGMVGTNTVTYAFTDGNGCSDTATAQTYIQPIVIPSIVGLEDFYCEEPDTIRISGNPAGGTFAGPGVDNNFGTDWYFIPSKAGVGLNDITYTTAGTNVPGQPLVCPADTTKQVQVRPKLVSNLLSPLNNSRFCSNDSLLRFTFDTLNSSVIHTFSSMDSNAVMQVGYLRYRYHRGQSRYDYCTLMIAPHISIHKESLQGLSL